MGNLRCNRVHHLRLLASEKVRNANTSWSGLMNQYLLWAIIIVAIIVFMRWVKVGRFFGISNVSVTEV